METDPKRRALKSATFAFFDFNFGQEKQMEKWKCKVCGYIYNPENGDPDGDIPPGTPFNKLPDSWVCPMCGAPKDMFEKE